MEAMACVHARVRQVVFGVANPMGGAFVDANALSSTTTTPTKASSSNHPTNESTTTHNEMNQGLFLHALPGTNHRYKVYACHPGSELWQKCHQTTERLALSTNHAGA
jgi:tRNA(Arg) A34 adenosine deaminase TadA